MTANTKPIFESVIKLGLKTIVNADSTNLVTVLTGGTNGTRIDQINITSNDTTLRNVNFYINDGNADFQIGYVPVAIGAGYPSVSLVLGMQYLQPVLGYMVIPSGYILKAAAAVAVTADKTITICAVAGDY